MQGRDFIDVDFPSLYTLVHGGGGDDVLYLRDGFTSGSCIEFDGAYGDTDTLRIDQTFLYNEKADIKNMDYKVLTQVHRFK